MNGSEMRSMGNKMLMSGEKKSRFTALVQKNGSSYHIKKKHSSHFLLIPQDRKEHPALLI